MERRYVGNHCILPSFFFETEPAHLYNESVSRRIQGINSSGIKKIKIEGTVAPFSSWETLSLVAAKIKERRVIALRKNPKVSFGEKKTLLDKCFKLSNSLVI